MQLTIVAAVNDLMFGSRIRAAAEARGITTVFARSSEALAREAAGAALVLIDLHTRWLDPSVDIPATKAATDAPVITFGAHVEGDLLKAAQAAGADRVMARSAFVGALPGMIDQLAEQGSSPK